jgi:uncharacterized protein (DUF885 family)
MKFLLLVLIFLASCAKVPFTQEDKVSLNELFENYWEEHSKLFPLDATSQGDHRFNDLLPNDQTNEFREKLKNYYQTYLDRLKTYDRQKLSQNDQVSYDVFEYEMKMQLEGLKSDFWQIPFQQFWGLPLTMGQLGSGESYQPFQTVKDYENWLSRLSLFEAWTNSAILNFKSGMKSGLVLPKVLVKKMIPQMKDMIVQDPTKSLFYGPIKKMPETFSPSDKERLRLAFEEVITNKVVPSFKTLAQFLENQYLPKARNSHGISSLKGGKEYYQYLVKYWTTTNKTPGPRWRR